MRTICNATSAEQNPFIKCTLRYTRYKKCVLSEKDVAKILYSRENWVKFDYKT